MKIISIRKSHPCMKVTTLCTITTAFLICIGTAGSQNINYKQMEILNDLPIRSDTNKCLNSLEKAVYFMKKNIQYVDLNVCFGVFLANTQLKNILRNKIRAIPIKQEVRLEQLVKVTDSIVANFTDELIYVANYANQERYFDMMNLFIGNTSWHHLLPRYNVKLLKKTQFYAKKDLEKLYCKWSKYQKLVYGADNRKDASKSDTCLALLAQNPTNHHDRLTLCQVPYKCAKLVLNGTNYGYAMTHRVLFLLLARFGRGCNLLSATEDREVLDRLCARLYVEAEFIANHDFQTSDLIMEIMTLCSLDGNAQFLRQSWIDELLGFQTNVGCFNVSRPDGFLFIPDATDYVKYPRKLFSDSQMILDGYCNSHTTSVAIAMLASAIRYIIENYY